jgi:murein DD-endopeptidase MepM/ murein hydrolase activator NlpD
MYNKVMKWYLFLFFSSVYLGINDKKKINIKKPISKNSNNNIIKEFPKMKKLIVPNKNISNNTLEKNYNKKPTIINNKIKNKIDKQKLIIKIENKGKIPSIIPGNKVSKNNINSKKNIPKGESIIKDLEDKKISAPLLNPNNKSIAIISPNDNKNLNSNSNKAMENIFNKIEENSNGKDTNIIQKNSEKVSTKKIINKNNLNKVINKNNDEINGDDFIEENEDAVLKAYALPSPNKIINLDENSLEDSTKDIKSWIIEESNLEKINEKYVSPTTKEIPLDERGIGSINNKKIINPAKKGANVNRETNKVLSSYEPLLEDGREIKRSFTIQDDIKILDFLLDNGVDKNMAETIAKEIENKDKIIYLMKGQYVILTIEKTKKYFKQHKINLNGEYSFKKLVLFFDNIVIYKLKNNVFQRKIKFNNTIHNNFYVVTWKKFEDFYNYFNSQVFFYKDEYEFLSNLFPFLIDKLEKSKIPILSIQLIFQIIENKNKKKIRGILIHTKEKIYCCFIYKDFAGNYHLLNEKGNSFNLEVLDIQKNPPINGRISSLFGIRKHPVLKKQRHHDGLDLSAPTHTPVHSVLSGWVLSSGFHKSYGNYIIISYGNMIYTLYGHLNKLFVTTGDYLENGRVVGTVGTTGRSSGPHLHYEIFTSDVNFFTIDQKKVNVLFNNRTVLNPILRYKIGIGLRSPELPYFLNLLKQLKSNEEVTKHIPFFK